MAVSKKTAAAAKSTAKQDVAGRRVKKTGEPQHAAYAEKAIPTRMQEYVEWLERETGYAVDARSVYLSSSLRGTFQKSDENQERIAARKVEIEQQAAAREQRKVEREQRKVEREAERARKAEEREAAKARAAEEKTEAPAKKTASKPAAGKKAPAKAAPTRRRPAKPAVKDTDADF